MENERKKPGRKPQPAVPGLLHSLPHYRVKFRAQKCLALKRGIEWLLSFEEWFDWWGKDIDLRGSSRHSLQMQRYGDTGPYALGNIIKGRPEQNRATWARMNANRKAAAAKAAHEKMLDALMWAASNEPKDEDDSDKDNDAAYQMRSNGVRATAAFAIDR